MDVRQAASCFGFLTVRYHGEQGYIGALLIVNSLARPIEFHCALPVKPTKSQTILYGPTLDEFICGEQIAKALIAKTKAKPAIIFTDATACLAVKNILHEEVLIAGCEVATETSEQDVLRCRPALSEAKLQRFALGEHRLATHIDFPSDQKQVLTTWQSAAADIDLGEPFGRIEQALLEAQPPAKAA